MPAFEKIFSTLDISASALAAERMKMRVIANNIANAQVTETPGGGPYKRKQVEFASVLQGSMKGKAVKDINLGGVRIKGITESNEPTKMTYMPGHPKANPKGFVAMPNISISKEMVDLMMASRSYEANSSVIKNIREMNQTALDMIRR